MCSDGFPPKPYQHRPIEEIAREWQESPRWKGIVRPYSPEELEKIRGTVRIQYTFAQMGAQRLWELLHSDDYLPALGALTGNQAIQQVEAGLKVIYLSGWQVAADANLAGKMYPDQSLYPANSVPSVVHRINNAFHRADEIQHGEGRTGQGRYWYAPIVADAEAGFGGVLNAFELMKAMIEAGAAGVHFEDQLSSAKKCGHMGGKVLVSTQEAVQKLVAARLAADALDVPTIVIARTDANGAFLITSDIDAHDHQFISDEPRTSEGFYHFHGGIDAAIARGLAYAPYADMIWCETSKPDLQEAKIFAEGIRKVYPDKLLSYNCSPSFNWAANLDEVTIAKFQTKLAAMGYKFQFVTLAGFHTLNMGMFDLAREYKVHGMSAYSRFQDLEFEHERAGGFRAITHQQFVGARYFDVVSQTIMGDGFSTGAMDGSTEQQQFTKQ